MRTTCESKLYLLPLSIGILPAVTFITTFCVALSNQNINVFFTYISDTGALPVESLIFAQGLNVISVLIGLFVYVRFKQVETFTKMSECKNLKLSRLAKLNKIGIFIGMISAVGVSVVGIFNEIDQLSVHVLGSWMAFGGLSLYLIIQAVISFRLVPMFGTKKLAVFRMTLSCGSFVLFFVCVMTAGKAMSEWVATANNDKIHKWLPENGGWTYRVISVISEWVLAALLNVYWLTFVPEFKKIGYEPPKFSFFTTVENDGRLDMENMGRENV